MIFEKNKYFGIRFKKEVDTDIEKINITKSQMPENLCLSSFKKHNNPGALSDTSFYTVYVIELKDFEIRSDDKKLMQLMFDILLDFDKNSEKSNNIKLLMPEYFL